MIRALVAFRFGSDLELTEVWLRTRDSNPERCGYRSLHPVQKWQLQFAECRGLPPSVAGLAVRRMAHSRTGMNRARVRSKAGYTKYPSLDALGDSDIERAQGAPQTPAFR